HALPQPRKRAIGACIDKIQRTFAAAGIPGEIVVCDPRAGRSRRHPRLDGAPVLARAPLAPCPARPVLCGLRRSPGVSRIPERSPTDCWRLARSADLPDRTGTITSG